MTTIHAPRNGQATLTAVFPPRISVVIPAYNQEKRVAAALWSVLHQSLPAHEILVVDDGSTDQTLQAARQINDHRIRILAQPHRGVSAARNRGIAAARADWIAFLDADDQWMPHKLHHQVNSLQTATDVQWCAGNSLLVRQRNGRSYVRPFSTPPQDRTPRLVSALDLLKRDLYPWQMPTVIIRRSALKLVGGFDESLRTAEDLDLYLRMARRHPQLIYHPQPNTLVFESPLSLSRQQCDALQMARKHLHDQEEEGGVTGDLAQFLALIALHESCQSVRRLAWKQAAQQLRFIPELLSKAGPSPCLTALARLAVVKVRCLTHQRELRPDLPSPLPA